jgi:hypothetical protein
VVVQAGDRPAELDRELGDRGLAAERVERVDQLLARGRGEQRDVIRALDDRAGGRAGRSG